MEVIDIPQSAQDLAFRKAVRDLLDQSQERVRIIAGEFGAYRYVDLREGVQSALHRGVPVEAFGNQRSPEARLMEQDGVSVTIGGLRSLHHYFVSDTLSTIVSFKTPGRGPTLPGTRLGRLYRNDGEMAAAVAAYQKFLQMESLGAPLPVVLERLARDIEAHPVLARRIRVADNVLSVAGVAGPAPSTFVDSVLASLRVAGSGRAVLEGDAEEQLAIVNQMAIMSATVAVSRVSVPKEELWADDATIPAGAVAEARSSLSRTSHHSEPSQSIWDSSDD